MPGASNAEATRVQGEFIRDLIVLNQNNFRFDLNLSGRIDGADVSAAKARSATKLP